MTSYGPTDVLICEHWFRVLMFVGRAFDDGENGVRVGILRVGGWVRVRMGIWRGLASMPCKEILAEYSGRTCGCQS